MSEMQDLTPRGRVDDALLNRILDTDCACGDTHGNTRYDADVAHAYVDAREGCGVCSCGHDDDKSVCGFGVDRGVLAAVYVPMQRFEGVYDTGTAMRRGTMFEGLDKPFYGDGKEVDCRGREK